MILQSTRRPEAPEVLSPQFMMQSADVEWMTLAGFDILNVRWQRMERKFTLEYWLDDDWYVGRIKEVPGVFSQGETLDKLEQNIVDAYKMVIAEEEASYSPGGEVQVKEVTVPM